jgi:hypothetical protein
MSSLLNYSVAERPKENKKRKLMDEVNDVDKIQWEDIQKKARLVRLNVIIGEDLRRVVETLEKIEKITTVNEFKTYITNDLVELAKDVKLDDFLTLN